MGMTCVYSCSSDAERKYENKKAIEKGNAGSGVEAESGTQLDTLVLERVRMRRECSNATAL